MKRLLFVVLALCMIGSVVPAFAQDEAIQVVSDAVTGLSELDSYTTRVEQTISQGIEMGASNMTNDIVQTIDMQVAKADEGYNLVGSIEQNTTSGMGTQTQELGMTLEMVVLDGTSYIRATELASMMKGLIPEVWTEVTETVAAANPALAGFSPQALAQYYGVSIGFDEESINSIEELEPAEVDGEPMRVFQVDYNLDALMESGMLDSITGSLGNSALGMSEEEIQQMIADMFAGAEAIYTLYVGDDGLLHQMDSTLIVDSTMNIQGMSLPLQMEIDSVIAFSGFNEPVTIEAPEVGT